MDDDFLFLLGIVGIAAWWWWNQQQPASSPGSPGASSVVIPNSDGGEVIQVDIDAKVQQMAEAIARAEGFYVPGSVPNRFHNPGDLGPGDTGYPGVFTAGSTVSQLPDDATGWTLLQRKLRNIFVGGSSVYNTGMTIEQMAQKWAGNWQAWANNVASTLGIPSSTTIEQWLAM